MMLDDHRIAIRERGYLELLDLSLRVIRAHAAPLAVAFLAGIGPFMLLNAWLLHGLAPRDIDSGAAAQYFWWMLVLAIWEIPLATAPATLYLGEALFSRRPEPRKVVARLAGSLPQLVLYQVLLRGLFMLPVVTWPVFLTTRLYLSEIILLERNAFRARSRQQVTTRRRATTLHRGLGGELFARWLGNGQIGLLLALSFWLSTWFLADMLFGDAVSETAGCTFFYPLALWFAIAFFTVVRFLGYLDLRIRREGWEVELLMRAERARWGRQPA